MINRLWLFGIILAIPLVGFGVSEGIQAYFNSQLRSAVIENHTDTDPSAVSHMSIDKICENAPVEFQEICSDNRNLNLMSTGVIQVGF